MAEWSQFYKALLAHEKGHKTIYENLVKEVQAAVDEYAKTVFFGEVCYGPEASHVTLAHNRALDLAEKERKKVRDALLAKIAALNVTHEKDQKDYETKTDHGRNQSAIGGTDVGIHVNVLLQ
jgi:predicted secreted Zn-dependent protease